MSKLDENVDNVKENVALTYFQEDKLKKDSFLNTMIIRLKNIYNYSRTLLKIPKNDKISITFKLDTIYSLRPILDKLQDLEHDNLLDDLKLKTKRKLGKINRIKIIMFFKLIYENEFKNNIKNKKIKVLLPIISCSTYNIYKEKVHNMSVRNLNMLSIPGILEFRIKVLNSKYTTLINFHENCNLEYIKLNCMLINDQLYGDSSSLEFIYDEDGQISKYIEREISENKEVNKLKEIKESNESKEEVKEIKELKEINNLKETIEEFVITDIYEKRLIYVDDELLEVVEIYNFNNNNNKFINNIRQSNNIHDTDLIIIDKSFKQNKLVQSKISVYSYDVNLLLKIDLETYRNIRILNNNKTREDTITSNKVKVINCYNNNILVTQDIKINNCHTLSHYKYNKVIKISNLNNSNNLLTEKYYYKHYNKSYLTIISNINYKTRQEERISYLNKQITTTMFDKLNNKINYLISNLNSKKLSMRYFHKNYDWVITYDDQERDLLHVKYIKEENKENIKENIKLQEIKYEYLDDNNLKIIDVLTNNISITKTTTLVLNSTKIVKSIITEVEHLENKELYVNVYARHDKEEIIENKIMCIAKCGNNAKYIIVPCGHVHMCVECNKEWLRHNIIKRCSMCRCDVTKIQELFF
jgi:hypothetical protein